MNLLFDFITIRYKTGAGEYVRTVFYNLLEEIKERSKDHLKIFALYDSTFGIAYNDLTKQNLSKKNITIEYIDLHKNDICGIIKRYHINRFFIGCAQYLGNYPNIDKISCETICVIHDMVDEEISQKNLNIYCDMLNPEFHIAERVHSIYGFFRFQKATFSLIKHIRDIRNNYWKAKSRTKFIVNLHKNNKKFHLITDSEFSKKSLSFNLKLDENRIKTFYLPKRIFSKEFTASNEIKKIFENRKIYLLLNANLSLKNPYNTLAAFEQFANNNPESYLLTINGPSQQFTNHISIPFLNDADYEFALKQCYALIYPSFFEGFGYPPIEAMFHKKPVFSSYTTSLPEILGDAPIYFSPLYATDIYKALQELTDSNYDFFSQKSESQYSIISRKSENDLKELLNYILEGIND